MALLTGLIRTSEVEIEKLEYSNPPRSYLGMSSLGEECSAKLWLTFHWCSTQTYPAKVHRIFEIGHEFEKIIIGQLKEAGFEVYKVFDDKEIEMFGHKDEAQETFVGFAGHAKGHNDGRIRGLVESKEDHLLEIKTAKNSIFNKFVKYGCKKANPIYYAQVQRYMRSTGLRRALFVVLNKDTAHLHMERIEADSSYQNDLIRKESMLIMADEIPARAYEPGFYKCGWCNQKDVCRKNVNPIKTCRTCEFADLEDGGVWKCSKDGSELSPQQQWDACVKYKLEWGFEDVGSESIKEEFDFGEDTSIDNSSEIGVILNELD